MVKKQKSAMGAANFTHEEVAAALKGAGIIRRGGKVFLVVAGEEIEVDREEMLSTLREQTKKTGKTILEVGVELHHNATDPEVREAAADICLRVAEIPEAGGYPIKPDPDKPH